MVNEPKSVILHCSATPDFERDDPNFDRFGITEIDEWHRQRGFEEVGYHFVVRRSGVIETGRDIKKIGAHTQGHNKDALGVCYIGTSNPTTEQLAALVSLYKTLLVTQKIQYLNWFGHNEFTSKKTCPGFPMVLFRYLLAES